MISSRSNFVYSRETSNYRLILEQQEEEGEGEEEEKVMLCLWKVAGLGAVKFAPIIRNFIYVASWQYLE